MPPSSEDLLAAYLQYVVALRDAAAPLDPAQLREVAREMGLSDADIAAAEQAGLAHFERGRNFAAHGRWDDAASELTRASALLPHRLDVLDALAHAHLGRWRAGGGPDDREAAERLARQCLAIAPSHKPAYELLNALDRRGSPNRRTAQAAVIVLVFLGLAAFGVLNRPIPRATTHPWASTAPAASVAPVAVDTEDAPLDDKARDLPLQLAPTALAKQLALEPRRVRLNNYEKTSYLSLGAILRSTGPRKLEALRARVELLDAADVVLKSDSFEPLSSHHAALLPGDGRFFSHTLKTTPHVRQVRLTVQTLDAVPYHGAPPKPRPVKPEWGVQAPADLRFELAERHALEKPHFDDQVYVEPTFVLRNTGPAAIKTLKVELEWRDRAERVLKAADQLLVYGEGAALLPGEARPVNWLGIVPGSYHHYELRVLEIE